MRASSLTPSRVTTFVAHDEPNTLACYSPRMLTALLLASLAQSPSLTPSNEFTVTTLTTDQLINLRIQLEEQRPALTAPIAVMAGGAVMTLAGAAWIVGCGVGNNGWCGTAYYGSPTRIIVPAAAISAVGLGLITWGAVWLAQRLGERRIFGIKLDAVLDQLELRKQQALQPQPAPAN